MQALAIPFFYQNDRLKVFKRLVSNNTEDKNRRRPPAVINLGYRTYRSIYFCGPSECKDMEHSRDTAGLGA